MRIPAITNQEKEPRINPILEPLSKNKNANKTIEKTDDATIIIGDETIIVINNIKNKLAIA